MMQQIAPFIWTIFISAATSAVVVGGLIWLAREWVVERLRSSIRHEYSEKLASLNATLRAEGEASTARLKAQIDREADKLRLATQSFGDAQKAAIDKRLGAVEELWRTVLSLNDAIPAAVTYLDILLPEEYPKAREKPTFSAALSELNHVSLITAIATRSRRLAELRPYLGEYLWMLFAVYQAVICRTIYLVDLSKSEPTKIIWFEDSPVRRHIQSALGDSGLSELDALRISKVNWVQERFNKAIIQAIDRIIAGKDFSEATIQQAERMEEQLRQSRAVRDEA